MEGRRWARGSIAKREAPNAFGAESLFFMPKVRSGYSVRLLFGREKAREGTKKENSNYPNRGRGADDGRFPKCVGGTPRAPARPGSVARCPAVREPGWRYTPVHCKGYLRRRT